MKTAQPFSPRARVWPFIATKRGTQIMLYYGNAICAECKFSENCFLDLVIRQVSFVECNDWLYACSAENKLCRPQSQTVRLLPEQMRHFTKNRQLTSSQSKEPETKRSSPGAEDNKWPACHLARANCFISETVQQHARVCKLVQKRGQITRLGGPRLQKAATEQ